MSCSVMDLVSSSIEMRRQESAQSQQVLQSIQESNWTPATRKMSHTQVNLEISELVSKSAELTCQDCGLKNSQRCMKPSTGPLKTTTCWDGQAWLQKQERESLVSTHHTMKRKEDGTKLILKEHMLSLNSLCKTRSQISSVSRWMKIQKKLRRVDQQISSSL